MIRGNNMRMREKEEAIFWKSVGKMVCPQSSFQPATKKLEK